MTLTARDAAALRALHGLMDAEHVVREPLGALLRASGLSQTTWQARAIPSLREQGLVETWLEAHGPRGHYNVLRYRITQGGLAGLALETTPRGVVPVSSRCRPGALSNFSFEVLEKTGERKKEGAPGTTPPVRSETTPVSSRGAVEEIATALQLALGVLEEQGRTIQALTAHLGVSMERCACGELKAPRTRKDGTTYVCCPFWPKCPARQATKPSREVHKAPGGRQDASQVTASEFLAAKRVRGTG